MWELVKVLRLEPKTALSRKNRSKDLEEPRKFSSEMTKIIDSLVPTSWEVAFCPHLYEFPQHRFPDTWFPYKHHS